MSGNTPNAVRSTRMVRSFYQEGGAGMLNIPVLFGQGMGYGQVSGITRPVRGGVQNISNFNPTAQGWQNVGSTETSPGFGKATVDIKDTQNGIPLPATFGTCPGAIYLVAGSECGSLGDIYQGYANGYVLVLPDFVLESGVTIADISSFMDDKEIIQNVPITIRQEIFYHGQKFFGQLATANAADLATNLTTDVVFGGQTLCQACGLGNNGTALKYWSVASTTASPGAKPTVIYQIRNATPVAVQVTSAAIAEDLTFIAVVGNYLVVGSQTAGGAGIGGYHYAQIGASGAPGSWTKVVTGFQSNHQPTDILVLSPTEIYFSSKGGYIYKSTNLAQGVSVINAGATTTNDLNRINGNRQLMVAVGATGTIIVSSNNGVSWSASPTTPPAGTPTWASVEVAGRSITVGSTTTARMFYSPDAGNTWYENLFDNNSGAGTISDIYWVNAYEGYFLFNPTVGNARIYNTFTGGAVWWNTSPAIEQLGGFTSFTRIAAPTAGNETLRANYCAVAGTASGTQGLLLTGAPNVF
jgi:hypothetical protein